MKLLIASMTFVALIALATILPVKSASAQCTFRLNEELRENQRKVCVVHQGDEQDQIMYQKAVQEASGELMKFCETERDAAATCQLTYPVKPVFVDNGHYGVTVMSVMWGDGDLEPAN